MQLRFTDGEGEHSLLHDFNNSSRCDWEDTFTVVAWLVRVDVGLERNMREILPCGLDFKPCPFEEWILYDDHAAPMSNLLYLYYFFRSKL